MYKSYIALEVRIQFPSETKAFRACAVNDNAAVSCPVCQGESGAVPLLNTPAARKAYLCSFRGCTVLSYEKLCMSETWARRL
ncbi:MAG: hypothetical protein LBK00_01480 [Treponema sp.]|nr:hypothetical protein [Treponema sp.]